MYYILIYNEYDINLFDLFAIVVSVREYVAIGYRLTLSGSAARCGGGCCCYCS